MNLEKVFREHAADLNATAAGPCARLLAFDGKALKGSFDSFNDTKARQVLSAFAVDTALVPAHIEIDEKSNEIPAVQPLQNISDSGMSGRPSPADLEGLVQLSPMDFDEGTDAAIRVGAARNRQNGKQQDVR
jgi:hypothetical protein